MINLEKKLMFLLSIVVALCMTIASCDKDENQELVDYPNLYQDLFKSTDNNLPIAYSKLKYQTEIPCEGGTYRFVLDENATIYNTGTNKSEPLKYFKFFLSQAKIINVDGDIEQIIDNAYEKSTSLDCFFLHYESYANGFTIIVEPNTSTEKRTILLTWLGFPNVAEFEITQSGK